MGINYHVLAGYAGNVYLLPGAPEPEWLYRRAEQDRILAQQPERSRERATPRLVDRLRVVFSRD